nr:unnamed protein product [Callosobruchus analis]
MAAGKKEFITRKTVKKQKRYLLDTVLNLFKKFVTGNLKISYQTFCRLRPFLVVKPNAQNRDTCLCIVHSNIDIKLGARHTANILTYNNHQKLLKIYVATDIIITTGHNIFAERFTEITRSPVKYCSPI